jgi:hypothetical protein
MTANGAYSRTPEATELTMIIWWCMGVVLGITHQWWQNGQSRSGTDKLTYSGDLLIRSAN